MVRVTVSPLNKGALAAAVRSGTPTLGTFIGSASPVAAEVSAEAAPIRVPTVGVPDRTAAARAP